MQFATQGGCTATPTMPLSRYGAPTFQICVLWGFLNHRLNIIELSGKVNKNTEWVNVLATAYLKMCGTG
jgi:hypothetical protein